MEDAAVRIDGIGDRSTLEFLTLKREEAAPTQLDDSLARVYIVASPDAAAAATEPIAQIRYGVQRLEAIMFDGATGPSY